MSVANYVETIVKAHRFQDIICDHRLIAGVEANCAPNRLRWSKPIQNLLSALNIELYSHQALATDHIRAGHSIVVSTPTASGKSLIYNLPVLEQCLSDADSHALYLFPLKALAQDQLQAFNNLTKNWPKASQPKAALYDGDTPANERKRIRQSPPQVLITNPEMLHLGIIPWHEQWVEFLAGLRIIVVDEAHTYRGVFGSNMAHVFRRLNRLVRRYGLNPVYVLCTATVDNPKELAAKLIDAPQNNPPVVIDKSGAPQGPRHFIFLNPTLSPSTTAIDLLSLALENDLRTIVYCQSRKMTELISIWAGSGQNNKYQGQISAYRAGFLPEERREIEAKMASGQLKCVVTTSALELGIDIGGLDVCILVGYPGSVMSTLQRGGRVGRAKRESCVIIIAGDDALDQYFANNPNDFFSRAPEKAVLNPDNPIIAQRHLECAAAEMPLAKNEPWLKTPPQQKALEALIKSGRLKLSQDQNYYLATQKNPERHISLRGGGQAACIEDDQGQIIGSLDMFRAMRDTHPGAVYLHRGESYVIQSLDLRSGRVIAKHERVKWFTRPRGQKTTTILEEEERVSLGRCLVSFGRLKIIDQITAYEQRNNDSNQLLAIHDLNLPPQIFETEGLWYVIPEAIRLDIENLFLHFMGSIHAMEHAIIGLLPLQVMADRNDFGGISIPLHEQLGLSAVFIYDGLPGGAGLTREAFKYSRQILEDTLKAVKSCRCDDGCPSCVHSPKCGSGNRPISKEGAIMLMEELLKPGTEGDDLFTNLIIEKPLDHDFNPTLDPPSLQTIAPKNSETSIDLGQMRSDQKNHLQVKKEHKNIDLTKDDSFNLHSSPKIDPIDLTKDNSLNLDSKPKISPIEQKNEEQKNIDSTKDNSLNLDSRLKIAPIIRPNYIATNPPYHFMVIDVETRFEAKEVGGWRNCAKMGVSVTIAYDNLRDKFLRFEQKELPLLFQRLTQCDLVVGFNTQRFDYQVLQPFAEFDLSTLPTLDLFQKIFERIHTRVSLNSIAQATLNAAKSANGLQAIKWWREGKIDDIAKYCEQDVALTRDIYLYTLKHGFIFYLNKAGQKVKLDLDLAN